MGSYAGGSWVRPPLIWHPLPEVEVGKWMGRDPLRSLWTAILRMATTKRGGVGLESRLGPEACCARRDALRGGAGSTTERASSLLTVGVPVRWPHRVAP